MEDLTIRRLHSQIAQFRIKELKEVLLRLGASRVGTKQVLVERLMSLLPTPEEVTKGGGKTKGLVTASAIEDVFSDMKGLKGKDQGKGLVPPGKQSTGAGHAKRIYGSDVKEETVNIRCPCGSEYYSGTMVQCDSSSCGVWQHAKCVLLPPEGSPPGTEVPVPQNFMCEICRLKKGDPFLETLSHPFLPMNLVTPPAGTVISGTGSLIKLESGFSLSDVHRQALYDGQHDLQMWSMLLNDKVLLRIHWPLFTEVRVNGTPVRAYHRPGQQALGANGRDEGVKINEFVKLDGSNGFTVTAYDGRPFVFGVRLVRKKTLQEVLNLIPSVEEGESLTASLARINRCISGGNVKKDEEGSGSGSDSDSELELVQDDVIVSLRCPMSGARMREAGRFKDCTHMGCFDLSTLVELNQRARKWQCPTCGVNHSHSNVIVDPYFHVITQSLANFDEEVTDVEVKADGSWRPRLEGPQGKFEPWRPPPTSVNVKASDSQSDKTGVEGGSLGTAPTAPLDPSEQQPSLKLGMKRTRDGWAINGMGLDMSQSTPALEAGSSSRELPGDSGKGSGSASLQCKPSAKALAEGLGYVGSDEDDAGSPLIFRRRPFLGNAQKNFTNGGNAQLEVISATNVTRNRDTNGDSNGGALQNLVTGDNNGGAQQNLVNGDNNGGAQNPIELSDSDEEPQVLERGLPSGTAVSSGIAPVPLPLESGGLGLLDKSSLHDHRRWWENSAWDINRGISPSHREHIPIQELTGDPLLINGNTEIHNADWDSPVIGDLREWRSRHFEPSSRQTNGGGEGSGRGEGSGGRDGNGVSDGNGVREANEGREANDGREDSVGREGNGGTEGNGGREGSWGQRIYRDIARQGEQAESSRERLHEHRRMGIREHGNHRDAEVPENMATSVLLAMHGGTTGPRSQRGARGRGQQPRYRRYVSSSSESE